MITCCNTNYVDLCDVDRDEPDPEVLKAEKHYRTLKARSKRKNRVDHEYRARLHAAGLGDVLNSFIKKGE
jgi:hypothetical protein